MLKYILFDLDNTLYPESCGIQDEIMRRMTLEVARYLNVDLVESQKLRDEGFRTHGTTLRWLQIEKNLSPRQVTEFLNVVHPENPQDFIQRDQRLNTLLENLPVPLGVLTNSPLTHAKRMLKHLGIEDRFTHVFDITFNQLEGKPNPQAYTRVLQKIGQEARDVLFLDDVPSYLDGFKALGGKTLLVDEFDVNQNCGHPKIRGIFDLPSFLLENRI